MQRVIITILLVNLFTARKIAFYACLGSVIAIGLAIYAILKMKRNTNPHRLASICLQSKQVRDYIKGQVQAQLKESEPNIDKIVDIVIEEVRKLQKLDEREKEEQRRKDASAVEESRRHTADDSKPQPSSQNVNQIVYYATAVDEGDNKTFIRVEDHPSNGETIFRFVQIQKGKCEYEVYEGAHPLVLTERGYLDGACFVDKTGSNRVVTTSKGIAELNVDGKWVVKTPAKVKIE